MKKQFTLLCFFLFLSFTINANAQNVNVNPGGGTYPTLKAAFDAINAGTHTGAVTVNIVLSTVETATASLNASGTGAASYTSVVVSITSPVTVEGTLPAAAIIKLNAADNVTIDGRIAGTGRNLTVRNNSNVSLSTGIQLANVVTTGPADTNGCQRNIIRNCEISCGARMDSTVSNAITTLGIGCGGVGVGSAGRNNSFNQILENRIVRVKVGIFFSNGVQFNLSQSNVISGNIVGPDVFGPDQIGRAGIINFGENNTVISCNTVQCVGGTLATNIDPAAAQDRTGITVGTQSWSSTSTTAGFGQNYTINGNIIKNIVEEKTFSSAGIICATLPTIAGSATNNTISNNVIYNVRANGTFGDQAVGIGQIAGRGDRIVYNSIYMFGSNDANVPVADRTTQYTAGIKILSLASDTALTIKNNSIYLDVTCFTTTVLNYCIVMPSAAYLWGSGGCNNNDYYFPAANTQMRTGGLGTSQPLGTSLLTLANWQAVPFVPAQDGASIQADPLYSLPVTTYLLMPMLGSPLLLAGTPIPGITQDIIGSCSSTDIRSVFNPTIGAYEFDSTTLPVEMSSFASNVNGRDVTLNWTTATELNNAGFDIERKSTEGSWSRIGNVAGNGTVSTPQNYSFTDRGLLTGKYNYRLKQIDYNGNFEYFNLTNEIGIGIPTKYELSQNYPNPFNPSTSINYDLPVDGKVSLKIFDMMGREVADLVNEVQTAGYYSINYNASSLSSGVYFYTISANNYVSTKKMMLVK